MQPHRGDGGHQAAASSPHFPLWNRLMMSLLAMALLWASSLRTAGVCMGVERIEVRWSFDSSESGNVFTCTIHHPRHIISVFFTERFARIPPATFPIRVCRSAFDAVSTQATAYRTCVARQLATCHADLDFATEQECKRSATAEAANVLKLDAAEVGLTVSSRDGMPSGQCWLTPTHQPCAVHTCTSEALQRLRHRAHNIAGRHPQVDAAFQRE